MNAKQLFDKGAGVARSAITSGFGLVQRVRHRNPEPKPGMDDVTLTRKVESLVFREEDAPKSSVSVNAVDRVVYLRGEVKRPEDIKALEARVRAVPEVRGVENLLHLPKTPTSERKVRKATPERPKTAPKVSGETRTAPGEPEPDELAAQRRGRQAAPLGGDEA
jgi:hypothetical protein